MSDNINPSGDYSSHTSDGFTVSTNTETAAEVEANFAAEEKPKDGPAADPEQDEADRVSEAASELGKKGGKAAAKARAKAEKEAKADKADDLAGTDGRRGKTSGQESEAEAEGDDESVLGAREDKPLGKPRDDPRARMLEATRKEAEAKRELASERAERQRLASENAALRASRATEQPRADASGRSGADPQDPEPKPEAFGGDEMAYLDARLRWSARDEFRKQQARHEQAQAQQRAAQAEAEAERNLEQAKVKYGEEMRQAISADPELMTRISPEVVALRPTWDLPPGQVPTALNDAAVQIFNSENRVALMLFLSENPDELQRLAALPTRREVHFEMGVLEGRLTAATSSTVVKAEPSKARPPVRLVTGSPNAAVDDDVDDDSSFERHVGIYNARDRKRARGA